MRIYDILDALTEHKVQLDFKSDEVVKVYSQFMVNKWLSMCEVLVPYAEQASNMVMSDEMHFMYLQSVLPSRKFYYKYIKADKSIDNDDKRYIADYFSIGIKDVNEFMANIEDDEIEFILSKYKYGKNKTIIV